MMAAGDRRIERAVDVYVKEEIKCLSDSDTRDRMKAKFDKIVEDSDWYRSISEALDKAIDRSSEKSYKELLLEIGGSTTDMINSNHTGSSEQISAELLQSKDFKALKEEMFREWDILRLDKKQEAALLKTELNDKQLVTMQF